MATKKSSAVNKAFTKSELFSYISEATGLAKRDISDVFEALGDAIQTHIKPKSIGSFTIPGLMKLVVKRKPATKARKGVNPFTGEEMTFKAKPARNVLKIRLLKKLKEMVD